MRLVDRNNAEVKEGNFIMMDSEEIGHIFEVKEGKLILVANWNYGLLNKSSINKYKEVLKEYEANKEEENVSYLNRIIELATDPDSTELILLGDKNEKILRKFIDEDLEWIGFGSEYDEEVPEAEFKDGTHLKGVYPYSL